MDKKQEKIEKVHLVMTDKLSLIADYIQMGLNDCAMLEINQIKDYLDYALDELTKKYRITK